MAPVSFPVPESRCKSTFLASTPVDGAPFRTLNRALQTVGSKDRLVAALGVSTAEVERYLVGKQVPPNYVFLAART